jgi:hypothetical protein
VPGAKNPIVENGFKSATTDPEIIERWWTATPTANIGIPTEHKIVIDVDVLEDGSENPFLQELPNDFEPGAMTVTPRGGRHFWFRQNGIALRNTGRGEVAYRVDTRADGGYALVPPSVTADGRYQWVADYELPRPEALPVVPKWLEQRAQSKKPKAETPAESSGTDSVEDIPEGQRNNTLTSIAGGYRRIGMSRDAIAAALQVVNVERCKPPLGRDEVAGIAKSNARYEVNQTAQAVSEGWGKSMGEDPAPLLQTLTSEELDGGDFTVEYLCEGVVPRAQPGVIGGPSKACKTSWTVYLFLCMALGRKFLDIFDCPKPIRCGLLSAESGLGSLQGQARRIVASMGETLGNVKNLHWSPSVLDLGNDTHLAAVEKWIRDEGLEALGLDPVYLLFPGVGEASNNLYAWGKFLNPLASICQRTGCTLVLNHHFRKTGTDPFGQPELSDLSNSGIANFVRWWGLINRRTKYDPEKRGQHEFWMSFGGSAGHSSAWAVDLDEGYLTGAWNWQARPAGAARAEITDERETAKERRKEERERKALEENATRLLAVFRQFPEGETLNCARTKVGLSGTKAGPAVNYLVENGQVRRVTLTKRGGSYEGFQPVQDGSDKVGQGRTGPDSSEVVRVGRTLPPIGESDPDTHKAHAEF